MLISDCVTVRVCNRSMLAGVSPLRRPLFRQIQVKNFLRFMQKIEFHAEAGMADSYSKSIIVKGNVSDIYEMWSHFEDFPLFMKYIKSVTMTGPETSHWVMSGPLGKDIEWDAETTRLEQNRRVAWNSKDNSAIKTSGQVTFKDLGGQETEVTVTLRYDVPGGKAGDVVAQLFSNPEARVEEDLRNFKAFAEDMQERTSR